MHFKAPFGPRCLWFAPPEVPRRRSSPALAVKPRPLFRSQGTGYCPKVLGPASFLRTLGRHSGTLERALRADSRRRNAQSMQPACKRPQIWKKTWDTHSKQG